MLMNYKLRARPNKPVKTTETKYYTLVFTLDQSLICQLVNPVAT